MAKEKEEKDSPFIIPENEYIPELESQVRYYLTTVKPQVKNNIKYSYVQHPNSKDPRENLDFEMNEIYKCKHGHNGMSGKMYFFYHYCYLSDQEYGITRPQYRTIARDWFQFIEDQQGRENKRGIVSIKRRRVGASWMEAADVLHDCIFTPYFKVGMNSKGENDSRELFKFVKFIYQHLPAWLRPHSTVSDRRDYMEFSHFYDKTKNKIVSQKGVNTEKRGPQSWILSVAPTDTAHEGKGYMKLIIDEAGKIPNLLSIWANSQDCIMKPPRRTGLPMVFGTVGDITKDGYGLKEMWEKNEVYKLDKFFFAGYNALDGMMDEFGNDIPEFGIRWIIYERYRLRGAKKELETFKQKYPLDEKDAFNQMSDGGVGNIQLINDQIIKINANPPEAQTGWMRANPNGGVDFVPNPEGKIIVYERPNIQLVNGYVAGADPADHDDKKKKAGKDVSDLALAIVAKPFGIAAPKLVLEYVDRPEKLDGFFEQSAMALKWYNNTKVLIEDNRARMINYFKTNYPHLLPLVPVSILTAKGGFEMKNSITMNEARKQQGMGLIEDNVDHFSQFIPSVRLLEQFKVFGDLHADDDLAMAYLLALIMLQADKKTARVGEAPPPIARRYEKSPNGMVRLVTHNSSNQRNIPRTLFGRK